VSARIGFVKQNPKENAKILKNFLFLKIQMAALVVLNSDLSKLTKTAIKKRDPQKVEYDNNIWVK
jgi:hypothetical protein